MALSKGGDPSKHETVLAPGAGRFINVIGDHQTVKLTGEQTGGMFAMAEDEMFYVCDGEMIFTVGDKEIVGTTGTTVYLPRGVPHGFRVNKKTRALVSVYLAGVEAMFYRLAELPAGPPDFEKVQAICAEYGIYFA